VLRAIAHGHVEEAQRRRKLERALHALGRHDRFERACIGALDAFDVGGGGEPRVAQPDRQRRKAQERMRNRDIFPVDDRARCVVDEHVTGP
jgi:hypothetical protein